jgi:hypothetical protein
VVAGGAAKQGPVFGEFGADTIGDADRPAGVDIDRGDDGLNEMIG